MILFSGFCDLPCVEQIQRALGFRKSLKDEINKWMNLQKYLGYKGLHLMNLVCETIIIVSFCFFQWIVSINLVNLWKSKFIWISSLFHLLAYFCIWCEHWLTDFLEDCLSWGSQGCLWWRLWTMWCHRSGGLSCHRMRGKAGGPRFLVKLPPIHFST